MTLEEELINDEGCELKPYRCTGKKLTLGVGRNIEDNGITKEEAIYLLRNDLEQAEKELMHFDWFKALNNARKDVLRNMCFNLGITELLKFKKFIAALEIKDFSHASIEMLDSLWAKQVGKRATRLSQKMKTGISL